jgi:hypothetical protein
MEPADDAVVSRKRGVNFRGLVGDNYDVAAHCLAVAVAELAMRKSHRLLERSQEQEEGFVEHALHS